MEVSSGGSNAPVSVCDAMRLIQSAVIPSSRDDASDATRARPFHVHLISAPTTTHLMDDFCDYLILRRERFSIDPSDANRRATDEVAPRERGRV